jgi:hypothetical protein
MSDYPDMWFGTCTCGAEYSIGETVLAEVEPGPRTIRCSQCAAVVELVGQHVKSVPFSAWTVLPPSAGCKECGREHEPDQPHDVQSLTYQYYFRSREARAGREERWPTWRDAMAHCTPEVQQRWTDALAAHGITVE